MRKRSRQSKANRVLQLSAKRMLAKLLGMRPSELKGWSFSNRDICEEIRERYERHCLKADRLIRNYDLASIVV